MKASFSDIKLLLSLTFFSLILILFDNLNFLNFPKSLAQTVTVPVQYGLYKSVSLLSGQLQFVFSARQAYLENKALRGQMGELMTENSTLRAKISENETFKDQYNKLSPITYDLLPARIVGTGRFITLDKGSGDGVVVGQAVVFKDNFLGTIREVNIKSSSVLLPFDPDSKIAVFSQGSGGRAKGILQGQFGSELLMDKILHQEKVEVDDLVYSEGVEGRITKGLVMGKVTEVLQKENEVFKQAKVAPLFNTVDLDIVFIMRNQ